MTDNAHIPNYDNSLLKQKKTTTTTTKKKKKEKHTCALGQLQGRIFSFVRKDSLYKDTVDSSNPTSRGTSVGNVHSHWLERSGNRPYMYIYLYKYTNTKRL